MKPLLFFLLVCTSLFATKVAGISGSIRRDSCNTKLVKEAIRLVQSQGGEGIVIDLGLYDLPFYNGDYEAQYGMPPGARQLRKDLMSSDRLILSTPEYNGAISPLLKNAIDWLSRGPEGGPNRDLFQGKRVLALSASPGQGGGARALKQLKELLTHVGAQVIPLEMALPNAYQAFDAQGHLINPAEQQQLEAAVRELLR